jgi:hypothetical protein
LISCGVICKNQVRIVLKVEGRFMLGMLARLAHGKFSLRTIRRSRGRGWLGRRIIDLDPSSFLAHDLLEFLWRRQSGSNLLFASLSPG